MRRQSRFSLRGAQDTTTVGAAGVTGDTDDSDLYTTAELFPYLSDADRASLKKEVVTAINNELVHTENLEVTVPRLLRSCANEAKELRRAINAMASSQLLEGYRAVQIIRESGERIRDLRALFAKQGDLITGMEVNSGSYKQLRQLHFLRENIASIICWSEALKEVRDTNLYTLLDQRKFLQVYKRLRHLQLIRRTVSERINTTGCNYRSAFDPYFEKLDALQVLFVGEVYKLLEENSVYLAIQMALEDLPDAGTVEENFPEFKQFEECVQICAEEVAGDGTDATSGALLCTADGEPLITEAKVYQAIRKCVAGLWEEQVMMDVVDPFTQISTYLRQMKKVAPLLTALEMTLIPLSTRFSFFSVVVNAIHTEVMSVLQNYADSASSVEANCLLEASEFVQWYKETLTEANYADYVDLGAVDGLCASILTAAVGGLSDHLNQLCRACAIAVRSGRSEPTAMANGLPQTTGPRDLFAVLQQFLGGLSTAIEASVMRQIGTACAEAIVTYLEECKLRSDYDYWEEENETTGTSVEEWSLRRLAFLYAFCNDCSNIEHNMDTIELKFVYYWSDEEGGESVSPFQKVQDLIVEHALFYVNEMVLHVERVVSAQWKLVFGSKEWYNSDTNPTQVIIDTMSDFIDEEFAVALEEERMRMTTREMMMRYIHKYLTTLMEYLADVIRHPNTKGVEDWNVFANCFSRDTVLAMNMWSERVSDGRGQLVNAARHVLEVIMHLLCVRKPVDFDCIVQKDLLEDFGDCPSFVIRFILQARGKDLDKTLCDAMLSLWNECVARQQRGPEDVPTVGWSRPPSFLGLLDRSLADLDKKSGLFRPSPRKLREKAERERQEKDKREKREARRARRKADAKPKEPQRSKRLLKTDEEVEVANLADLLK